MSKLNKYYTRIGALAAILIVFASCERELSDQAVLPTFPSTAEIYTDDFVGMGTNFYLPFGNAKPDVFSIDNGEGHESNSSIRIDVPNANDPSGGYAGAIFRVDGPGRNLTKFDPNCSTKSLVVKCTYAGRINCPFLTKTRTAARFVF